LVIDFQSGTFPVTGGLVAGPSLQPANRQAIAMAPATFRRIRVGEFKVKGP
jgi:hypothetical protein